MNAASPASFTKKAVLAAIIVGVTFLIAANAHLVYVAVTSQPDCVQHIKRGTESGPGVYSAARSAC